MSAKARPSCAYGFADTLFPLNDRRASPRFHTVCLVVKVERDGNVGLFRARNISEAGMMLQMPVRLEVGEALLINVSERLAIHANVLWSDGECCGVLFEQPIDCAAMLQAGAGHKQEDRRGGAQRMATMTRATSYAENGIRPVKVTDVSHRGMGLTHDGSLRPGMSLALVLESGIKRAGAVRWASQDRAGIRLSEPLTCEELGRVGGFTRQRAELAAV